MRSTQCQRWELWWEVPCTGECVEMLSWCSSVQLAFLFFLAGTLSDPLLSLIVQWYLSWGRSACCRAHRFRTLPPADHREHSEEPLRMSSTQGWPGCHTCLGHLWPVTTTQGQKLNSFSMLFVRQVFWGRMSFWGFHENECLIWYFIVESYGKNRRYQ